MRTEINREYKWGFLLSEQEIRRVAQTCQEHAAKVGAGTTPTFTVRLKDGSLIESSNVDDVLTLENGGQKAITRLTARYTDGLEPPKALLAVHFEDGLLNPKTWDSITVSVVGDSRDAVFVAAADLDDRIKKIRSRAWPYVISRPWFFVIPMLLGMALASMAARYFSPAVSAVETVDQAYRSGRVTNPIEALILLERLKASPPMDRELLMIITPFTVPFLVFSAAAFFVPKVSLSYVFYWGDAVPVYNKRRSVYRIFWVVVVLGVVASLIAGLILRLF